MSTTRSGWESPAAPATMMAGVTQPTIMATTCCKAKGRASKKWGMPSMAKSEALRVFEIGSFSTMVHLL